MNAPGTIGESARMYAQLEARISGAAPMETVGLRYGFFTDPAHGTGRVVRSAVILQPEKLP
ncbi:hypothetical protein RAA17_16525 [Komagataeibacter rhaeticus]|nr:hypothetical protein [Komagataeibacter rhaeticus]